jgi:hypothetical protein
VSKAALSGKADLGVLDENGALFGISTIAGERQRQIVDEGWTVEHDREHVMGELAQAASFYAWYAGLSNEGRDYFRERPERALLRWPFDPKWWKPSPGNTPKDRALELVKAGALIAAEIDRLRWLDGHTQ